MANKSNDLSKKIEYPMEPLMRKIEYPMEPVYYTFLLDAITDKKQRKALKDAITNYHKACRKAYRQLLRDLNKCKKKFS
jgi:hypothetical protein